MTKSSVDGPYNRSVIADDVKARAAELGFDLCGIAPVATHKELGFLREWLGRGYAGEMQYLERTADRREDVRAGMPAAKSVVCLGTVHHTDRPYSTAAPHFSPPPHRRHPGGDSQHDLSHGA